MVPHCEHEMLMCVCCACIFSDTIADRSYGIARTLKKDPLQCNLCRVVTHSCLPFLKGYVWGLKALVECRDRLIEFPLDTVFLPEYCIIQVLNESKEVLK